MADDEVDWGIFKTDKKKDKRDAHRTEKEKVNVARPSYQETSIVKPVELPKISRPTRETHYKNDHPNIGVALIFNHVNIQGQSKRNGSVKDKKRVKEVLRKYGFDVRTFNDYSYEKIVEVLAATSQEDHSKNDCLVVIVMSHGKSGEIYAEDMTYPVEKLWKPFLGEKCKSLIDKPKIFLIQACRGEELDSGATFRSKKFSVMMRGSDEIDIPVAYTIPNTADLLVFYSTFEGHYSWRNPQDGSWFIQSVSHVLEEYLKREDDHFDLYHLLTEVNRKVAYEFQSNVPNDERFDEMKAMPNFVSTLTKLLYIRPKP